MIKKNKWLPLGTTLLLALMVSASATLQNKTKVHQFPLKHKSIALFSPSRSSPNRFSNANNFKSALQSAIDPRTGTLSCAIVVGQLNSNWSKGPFYQLALHYTGGTSENFDGIGNGWQWNLPHYNLKTHTLTTRRGRTFLLIQKADGLWKFRYHKLKDAVITGSPHTGWILTLKTGIREYFSPQGYITKMEAETGDWITFHYIRESNKELLTYVSDENHHKIKIKRAFGIIKVSSLDSKGQPLIMTITTSNNKIHSVIFPAPITSPAAQIKKRKKCKKCNKFHVCSPLYNKN